MSACHMQKEFNNHIPVMLNEAVEHLITSCNGIYVDATFGRGSHSKAILDHLDKDAKLIAFDKDDDAVQFAKVHHAEDPRFHIIHDSFATMQQYFEKNNLMGKVNGILFDLGVSSPQLDNPERGFSFSQNGPLDMRMNTHKGQDAASWLAKVDETTLADILYRYGDEKASRRIARTIIENRELTPITTTHQLAELIRRVMPRQKHDDKHPATRSFQAIRIFINQELNDLETALAQAYQSLAIGGRLVVISFHSLEDRIVKQFIHRLEKGEKVPRGLPIKHTEYPAQLKAMVKPIKPSAKEIDFNPRARSAILRIAEKIS